MFKITIVTPIYNSMRTINEYMKAVITQKYSQECLDIIFVDGGSTDGTIEAIKSYMDKTNIKITILDNPLRTAEAGKAIGVRYATGEIICLLDSDNILPDENWFVSMVEPFVEKEIVASEPISYTYRKTDSIINRYCALIGMNDPLCLFTGNYDRQCLITGKWTEIEHEEIDKGNYLSIKFQNNMIPTIGANGFLIRRNELLQNFEGDYLFDIDILWNLFCSNDSVRVAKVKVGIIHLFSPDIKTFYKKQDRRIRDFLYYRKSNIRKYPWGGTKKRKIILFIVYCITIIPLVIQAFIGNMRKSDIEAWSYHLLACWITLWVYGVGVISGLYKTEIANRNEWKQ